MTEQDLKGLFQDESFLNYCLGKNPDDVRKWENFLLNHPEQSPEILNLKNIVREAGIVAAEMELKGQFARLQQRIHQPPTNINVRRLNFRRAISVAASLIFCVAAAYILFSNTGKNESLVFETGGGERKLFTLPDGSTVMLNGNSRISLSSNFNVSDRILDLDGEGFFTVSPSAQKPFLVKTGGLNVRVLGTTFNLKAYSSDSLYEASLVSGKIEVEPTGKTERIILNPDQKYSISYRKDNSLPEKNIEALASHPVAAPLVVDSVAQMPVELSWTENTLVFRDEPLRDVALRLSRWYGVDIQVEESSISDEYYSGTFRNEKIDDVLKSLGFSGNFKFRKEGGKIIVFK